MMHISHTDRRTVEMEQHNNGKCRLNNSNNKTTLKMKREIKKKQLDKAVHQTDTNTHSKPIEMGKRIKD